MTEQCSSCGEKKEHAHLIPKPGFFITGNLLFHLTNGGDLICLKCLAEEIEQTKETH